MTTWTVRGLVNRVIDGDTVVVDLDLGWRIWRMREPVRLAGINAPEPGTPEGDAATVYLRELLPTGLEVWVRGERLDKYGRVLATLMTAGLPVSVNEVMLSSGHAVAYRSR